MIATNTSKQLDGSRTLASENVSVYMGCCVVVSGSVVAVAVSVSVLESAK